MKNQLTAKIAKILRKDRKALSAPSLLSTLQAPPSTLSHELLCIISCSKLFSGGFLDHIIPVIS
jgi:hypothetical protein